MKTRLLTALLASFSLLALAGCFGGDDGDGPARADAAPAMIDAGPRPDAPPAAPDAGPMHPPSADVGKPCTGAMDCPMDYICAALDGESMLDALCTTKCGETEQTPEPMSPMEGQAVCDTAYTGSVGVAACVIYNDDPMTMKRNWYCGILCGQAPGTDGSCPGGLTCEMDLCRD